MTVINSTTTYDTSRTINHQIDAESCHEYGKS